MKRARLIEEQSVFKQNQQNPHQLVISTSNQVSNAEKVFFCIFYYYFFSAPLVFLIRPLEE